MCQKLRRGNLVQSFRLNLETPGLVLVGLLRTTNSMICLAFAQGRKENTNLLLKSGVRSVSLALCLPVE